jgi:hypothetical protein
MTASQAIIRLHSDQIAVEVDLARGAEITSVLDLASGVEVLMSTPWADEARSKRPLRSAVDPASSEAEWMSTYAGGWQTLVPHAGDPEEIDGVVRSYHGEASSVAWILDETSSVSVSAHIRLETLPMSIERAIHVTGGAVSVTDVLTNHSSDEIAYDYQSHPAFGSPFLDAGCRIRIDAKRYVPDPRFDLGELAPGVAVDWPVAHSRGHRVDLAAVPAPGSQVFRFGWLEGIVSRSVSISNPRLALEATLDWETGDRDHAWLWLDSGARITAPWNGSGYVLAIEPSTRATVRTDPPRRLEADSTRTFLTRITLRTIRPVTEQCQDRR